MWRKLSDPALNVQDSIGHVEMVPTTLLNVVMMETVMGFMRFTGNK
jgi:hypothetical protein